MWIPQFCTAFCIATQNRPRTKMFGDRRRLGDCPIGWVGCPYRSCPETWRGICVNMRWFKQTVKAGGGRVCLSGIQAIAAHIWGSGTLWPQLGICLVRWCIFLWCWCCAYTLHARWYREDQMGIPPGHNNNLKEVFSTRKRWVSMRYWGEKLPQLLVWLPFHPLYWS